MALSANIASSMLPPYLTVTSNSSLHSRCPCEWLLLLTEPPSLHAWHAAEDNSNCQNGSQSIDQYFAATRTVDMSESCDITLTIAVSAPEVCLATGEHAADTAGNAPSF